MGSGIDGYTTKYDDDPNIACVDRVLVEILESMKPGKWLVDIFPACKTFSLIESHLLSNFEVKYLPTWFPGASFHKQALLWRKSVPEISVKPYLAAKSEVVNGFPSRVSLSCYLTQQRRRMA